MKSVILLGKRRSPISPRAEWPDAELWGCSGSQQRYTAKFGPITDWTSWHDYHHIHQTKFHKGIALQRPDTLKWYQSLPGPGDSNYRPLYLLEADRRIPASARLPIEEIRAAFPQLHENGRPFFSCQVDIMTCWAMMQGFEHIIYSGHGCKKELLHAWQHRGILYWIAAARAMGVRVTLVEPSLYAAPPKIYGSEMGSWAPERRP